MRIILQVVPAIGRKLLLSTVSIQTARAAAPTWRRPPKSKQCYRAQAGRCSVRGDARRGAGMWRVDWARCYVRRDAGSLASTPADRLAGGCAAAVSMCIVLCVQTS